MSFSLKFNYFLTLDHMPTINISFGQRCMTDQMKMAVNFSAYSGQPKPDRSMQCSSFN